MSLTAAERKAILDAADKDTRDRFANEVAARTTLTQPEVARLAKSKAERRAFAETMAEVAKARASNASKAKRIRNISGGVEALVKIATRVI